jgi:hypothetical protein
MTAHPKENKARMPYIPYVGNILDAEIDFRTVFYMSYLFFAETCHLNAVVDNRPYLLLHASVTAYLYRKRETLWLAL